MCAVGALMVVGGTGIFLSFLGSPHLDRDTVKFGALYITGSATVSFVTFRIYRWLGRREPPPQ